MPDMDGGEVAAQLRADGAFKATPIVFLTALVKKQEVAASGGDIGGFPYIAKPLEPEKVIDVIEQHTA
jgi:CheY-like chemotaxis protein